MFKNFPGFNMVEQMHNLRQNNRFDLSILKKKSLGLIFVGIIVMVLWFLPTESFGMDGLTHVQQRIIAIFVYATLMWVLEIVPAWATSVSIMVLLLLFTSDSGLKWICNPAVV
ncbi:MAG: dihydroorotate dehydrogenase, partial [Bacteroidales bacterium]|nr:dihydroorotate dehydrogenase [Bacteroidales bacterium]